MVRLRLVRGRVGGRRLCIWELEMGGLEGLGGSRFRMMGNMLLRLFWRLVTEILSESRVTCSLWTQIEVYGLRVYYGEGRLRAPGCCGWTIRRREMRLRDLTLQRRMSCPLTG